VFATYRHFPTVAWHWIYWRAASSTLVCKVCSKAGEAVRLAAAWNEAVQLRQVCIADLAGKVAYVVSPAKLEHGLALKNHFIACRAPRYPVFGPMPATEQPLFCPGLPSLFFPVIDESSEIHKQLTAFRADKTPRVQV